MSGEQRRVGRVERDDGSRGRVGVGEPRTRGDEAVADHLDHDTHNHGGDGDVRESQRTWREPESVTQTNGEDDPAEQHEAEPACQERRLGRAFGVGRNDRGRADPELVGRQRRRENDADPLHEVENRPDERESVADELISF